MLIFLFQFIVMQLNQVMHRVRKLIPWACTKTKQNLNVAMKENAAILFEENADAEYAGFDANSVESYIQFNLFQDENLDQSSALADNIQKQFKDRVGQKGPRCIPGWFSCAVANGHARCID